jgi:dienelactone hydrolase
VNRSAPPSPPARTSRHGQVSGGRFWRRITLGAAAVVLLGVGALVAARAATSPAPARPGHSAGPVTPSPTHAPPRPRPPRRLPVGTIGSYAVAEQRLHLVDRSRARLGPRALPTIVRYPVIPPAAAASGRLARGLFPLVVFAPGFMQCDPSYNSLLHAWASAGYVVAAVTFPRTNCHVAGPDEDDLVNQPADLAYVIRRVLAVSGRRRGVLAGLVNPAEIAVAGHSDGGDTVAAIAANSCCRDRLVKATIVLAGAEWAPLGGSYFAKPTSPILFVQGNADVINLPADSLTMYQADKRGRRFYLDLFGAGHLPPYEGHGRPEPVVARVTVDFLDRYLAGQRGAAAAMRRAGNVAGVAALVSGGRPPP